MSINNKPEDLRGEKLLGFQPKYLIRIDNIKLVQDFIGDISDYFPDELGKNKENVKEGISLYIDSIRQVQNVFELPEKKGKISHEKIKIYILFSNLNEKLVLLGFGENGIKQIEKFLVEKELIEKDLVLRTFGLDAFNNFNIKTNYILSRFAKKDSDKICMLINLYRKKESLWEEYDAKCIDVSGITSDMKKIMKDFEKIGLTEREITTIMTN